LTITAFIEEASGTASYLIFANALLDAHRPPQTVEAGKDLKHFNPQLLREPACFEARSWRRGREPVAGAI
jgi:hypothetical protein